jgi:hypothetical protein
MDQCGGNYKTLFMKVFHILVYLTILKLQYVFFEQTYTKHFIPYSLPKEEFQ